jgi:hypothetical protein
MVISRTCSVVGCDEYARLTRKYIAKNKSKKKEVINVDLCYRHRHVGMDQVEMIGEFERTPGNITRKEQEASEDDIDTDGPVAKIELDYDDDKNAKLVK